MSYTLEEYADRSRRWSVLKHLSATVFSDYAAMVFSPAAEDSSFYLVRYPTGNTNRPMAAFEYLYGQPMSKGHGITGSMGWRETYQLTVIAGWLETAGTLVPAEELLDIWLKRLRKLDKAKIPFYDYRLPAAPVRDAGFDFVLQYVSDRRMPELVNGDKNMLVVQWVIEG